MLLLLYHRHLMHNAWTDSTPKPNGSLRPSHLQIPGGLKVARAA